MHLVRYSRHSATISIRVVAYRKQLSRRSPRQAYSAFGCLKHSAGQSSHRSTSCEWSRPPRRSTARSAGLSATVAV